MDAAASARNGTGEGTNEVVGVTTHRPAVTSSVLSVLCCAVALWMIGTGTAQRVTIVLSLLAVAPVAVGIELHHREHALAGIAVGLVGLAGGIAVFAYLATATATMSAVVELVPGILGLYVLALALGPVWSDGERLLLSAGTGFVLLSVIVSLIIYETDLTGVLVGGIATILAWDLAEQAVNLGEQVGREPATRGVELVHGAGTAGVGVVAGGVVLVLVSVDVSGLSLAGLAGLLGAGLTLTLALYN